MRLPLTYFVSHSLTYLQALSIAVRKLRDESHWSGLTVRAEHYNKYLLQIESGLGRGQHQVAWPNLSIWEPYECIPYDIVECVKATAQGIASLRARSSLTFPASLPAAGRSARCARRPTWRECDLSSALVYKWLGVKV